MENKKKNPALEKAIKLQSRENTFENGQLINTVNGVYSGAMIDEVRRTDNDYKKSTCGSNKCGNGSAKVDQNEDYDCENRVVKTEEMRERELKLLKKEKDKSEKEKNRDNRRRKTSAGWVTAVCVLSITTATFGGLLAYNLMMPTPNDRSLENLYDKSFYSAVDRVNNADLNMDKFLVTADDGASVKYLLDVSVDAEIAEENFAQLPLNDEDKLYTAKLVNQVADYSKYLAKKLADGRKLTDEEIQNAKAMSKQLKALKETLNDMHGEPENGYGFKSLKKNGTLQKGLKEIENQSVEYPSLIYDGPFSDGKDSAKMKGLTGKEISKDDAMARIEKIFSSNGVSNVEYDGEITGRVSAYAFSFDSDFGRAYAQISKNGGHLLMLTSKKSDVSVKMRSDKSKDSEDIASAENFLSKLGIDDMKAVWTTKVHGVSVINFVGQKDGVIIYPDMIKVKVHQGNVVGLESFEYYLNHTDRVIDKPTVSESDAKAVLSSELVVKNSRLAVVPKGNSEELCYEFMCKSNDSTYYAYISATTKKQVELFKVQYGTEGVLLR